MKVAATSRVFALLGDPVAHSMSPQMHNAAFGAMGIDATYVALRCAAVDLPHAMRVLASAGGGGNVTVPHKRTAATVGRADPVVERLGVANAFGASADGELATTNTDVEGVIGGVTRLGGTGGTWLVIGTGGSARAVAGAAAQCGVRLAVASRDPGRAADFGMWADSIGAAPGQPDDASLVINATPLGLDATDPLPIDPVTLPSARLALDLTYRADGPTAWCRAWHARGCDAIDGRETLLVQGAAAWRLWLPGVQPPVELMRAVLHGRLG